MIFLFYKITAACEMLQKATDVTLSFHALLASSIWPPQWVSFGVEHVFVQANQVWL